MPFYLETNETAFLKKEKKIYNVTLDFSLRKGLKTGLDGGKWILFERKLVLSDLLRLREGRNSSLIS